MNTSYYHYNTNGFTTITLEGLEAILLYGAIGGIVLIVLPVLGIALWEGKQMKNSQNAGVEVIVSAIIKIFLFSALFLLAIQFFFIGFTAISGAFLNPAYAIDWFFHTEWLDMGILTSLENGILPSQGQEHLESGKTLVAILSIFRTIYIGMLLGLFFFFVFSGTSYVFKMYDKSNEQSAAEATATLFLAGSLSALVFVTLLEMISISLNAVLYISDALHSTSYATGIPVDITKDLAAILNIGIDQLTTLLNNN